MGLRHAIDNGLSKKCLMPLRELGLAGLRNY